MQAALVVGDARNDGACGEPHSCRQNYDDSFTTHGTPQKTPEEMKGDRSEWAVASAIASIVSASIDAESSGAHQQAMTRMYPYVST